MMGRLVLWSALGLTLILLFLTLLELFLNGPNVLMAFSLLVIAMFGLGVIGALREK